MKWEEVRKIYPNQFVKFEILTSHTEKDKKYIDDVAIIVALEDCEATKELLHCKENILVYHTSKETVVLTIRKRIGLRRAL